MKQSKAQKLGNPANPAFTFWIENKIANKTAFFISDLKQLFEKWLNKQEKDWLQYYSSEQVVRSFITAKDGINAVNEEKEFPELLTFLKPVYTKIAYTQ